MTSGLSEPVSGRRGRFLELTGLLYLLVLALLVALSIASYRHVFTDHIIATVMARTAGQQLNPGGDVRMNGAIVGSVSKVHTVGRGARVDLMINAKDARRIPSDVQARILPTTLFGQKYVELRSSSASAANHLRDGSIIREDGSVQAVELTDVLDDLDPVIRAVHPEQLQAALSGLSTGLSGRGDDIHALMDDGGSYLGALNRRSSTFERDLRLLRDVSGEYADATPDFLNLLHNSSRISRTLTDDATLAEFLTAVIGAADSGHRLLKANGDRLAQATRLSRPTLELLAEYSPEFVCVIGGFLRVESGSAAQIQHHLFQGYFTVGKQARGYKPSDALVLGDVGTGPHCRGLPNAPIPYPGVDLDDGVGDLSSTPGGLG